MSVTVTSITGEKFDFGYESRQAAVNEACESLADAQDCTIDGLCPCCAALAKAIELRLVKAYNFGRGCRPTEPVANRLCPADPGLDKQPPA